MKTALDVFVEQLEEHLQAYHLNLKLKETEGYEMAKILEKEQIIEAVHINPLESIFKNIGIDYYNQTYNQKD